MNKEPETLSVAELQKIADETARIKLMRIKAKKMRKSRRDSLEN